MKVSDLSSTLTAFQFFLACLLHFGCRGGVFVFLYIRLCVTGFVFCLLPCLFASFLPAGVGDIAWIGPDTDHPPHFWPERRQKVKTKLFYFVLNPEKLTIIFFFSSLLCVLQPWIFWAVLCKVAKEALHATMMRGHFIWSFHQHLHHHINDLAV